MFVRSGDSNENKIYYSAILNVKVQIVGQSVCSNQNTDSYQSTDSDQSKHSN